MGRRVSTQREGVGRRQLPASTHLLCHKVELLGADGDVSHAAVDLRREASGGVEGLRARRPAPARGKSDVAQANRVPGRADDAARRLRYGSLQEKEEGRARRARKATGTSSM